MTTTQRRSNMSLTIGQEFRYAVADSNPLWRVTKQVRPGVYEAVCVNEPFEVNGRSYESDGAGQRRRFTAEDITAAVRHADFWNSLSDEHDAWWAATAIGQILHYHNGFGQYVRGVVVNHEGKHCLQPTALVGNWRPVDLPRRDATGDVAYSTGGHFFDPKFEPWQPSSGCMFEHPGFSRPHVRQCQDPTTAEPIDLTFPQPTAEERELARLHKIRIAVYETVQYRNEDVREQLARVKSLLEQV
jgi:hypothetical protein